MAHDAVSASRFVQRSPTTAEFEVVPGPSWRDGDDAAIAASLAAELPATLALRVVEVATIERGTGGKRQTIVRLS